MHFARNLLAHVAMADGEVVTAAYRTVFAQPTAAGVQAQWDSVAATFQGTHPKVAAVMDAAREDVLAFMSFPAAPWKQIWSTNPLERLNKEVKRRTDVIGVFPNDAALLRLTSCVLIEAHDDWAAGERRPVGGVDGGGERHQRRRLAGHHQHRPVRQHQRRHRSRHDGMVPSG